MNYYRVYIVKRKRKTLKKYVKIVSSLIQKSLKKKTYLSSDFLNSVVFWYIDNYYYLNCMCFN